MATLKKSLEDLSNAALSLEYEQKKDAPDEDRVKLLKKEISTRLKEVKDAIADAGEPDEDDDADEPKAKKVKKDTAVTGMPVVTPPSVAVPPTRTPRTGTSVVPEPNKTKGE
jgi:hypothetical protein